VKNTKFFQISYQGEEVQPTLIMPTSNFSKSYLYASPSSDLGQNSHFTVIPDKNDSQAIKIEFKYTED